MKVAINYSPTFNNLIDLCIDYLSPFSSEKGIVERILEVIDRFEKVVTENRFSCHVSPHLLSLGITNYREFTLDGFRILYRVEQDNSEVQAVVFCSQKQDLTKLLVDYCLLYK